MGEVEQDNKKENRNKSFRLIWGLFMVAAYMGIAYLAVFTPVLIRYNADNVPGNDQNFVLRIIFGSVVFLYGLFRGYRLCKNGR